MRWFVVSVSAGWLLAGYPHGAFAEEEPFHIGDLRFAARRLSAESAAVAAADLDGDGHQDVVIGGPQLSLYRGDGKGGFVSLRAVAGGENPVDFAIEDLDGDGDVDIAVANHETDYLTILLGDGRAAFRPAHNSPLRISVSPHPHAVRASDLDSDGIVDLIVDHRARHGLLVLSGIGDCRFESPGVLVEAGGDPYRGMAVGDANGEGKPDLLAPNPHGIGVLLNVSEGHIAFVQASPVPAAAPFAVEVGDFNGDDLLDVVVASDEDSPLVEIFLGDGRGHFSAAAGFPFRFAPGGKKIAVGDFNGDGFQDAAVSSYESSDVLVLMGGSGPPQSSYLPGGEAPWGLAAADFNEDGVDDLVIGDDANPHATLYLSVGGGEPSGKTLDRP